MVVNHQVNAVGKTSDELLEILHELCKTHDWFFTMSDDSRAYHAGLAEADEIEYVRSVLDAMGFGTTADTIIGDYKPAVRVAH